MYIYNTIYNYYIHFLPSPLLIKADSTNSIYSLPIPLHHYIQTRKEDEDSRQHPLYFAVTLVTRHVLPPQNTPRHPPFGLTARSAVPRIPSALTSRSPLNPLGGRAVSV